MTVAELIDRLQKYDPGQTVVGSWDSGYGHIDGVANDEKSGLLLLDVSMYEAFDE